MPAMLFRIRVGYEKYAGGDRDREKVIYYTVSRR